MHFVQNISSSASRYQSLSEPCRSMQMQSTSAINLHSDLHIDSLLLMIGLPTFWQFGTKAICSFLGGKSTFPRISLPINSMDLTSIKVCMLGMLLNMCRAVYPCVPPLSLSCWCLECVWCFCLKIAQFWGVDVSLEPNFCNPAGVSWSESPWKQDTLHEC